MATVQKSMGVVSDFQRQALQRIVNTLNLENAIPQHYSTMKHVVLRTT